MIRARHALALVPVLALLGAAAGCGDDDDDGSGAGTQAGTAAAQPLAEGGVIGMKGLKFDPAAVQVKVGQEVTWRNEESIPHNVVAEEGADFKSEVFTKDKTYTFTPTKAGTIAYVCTLHPGMDGTLEVVE